MLKIKRPALNMFLPRKQLDLSLNDLKDHLIPHLFLSSYDHEWRQNTQKKIIVGVAGVFHIYAKYLHGKVNTIAISGRLAAY